MVKPLLEYRAGVKVLVFLGVGSRVNLETFPSHRKETVGGKQGIGGVIKC